MTRDVVCCRPHTDVRCRRVRLLLHWPGMDNRSAHGPFDDRRVNRLVDRWPRSHGCGFLRRCADNTGLGLDFFNEAGRDLDRAIEIIKAKQFEDAPIAFYDENTLDDGRWFMGHEVAQRNYTFILEKFLADKTAQRSGNLPARQDLLIGREKLKETRERLRHRRKIHAHVVRDRSICIGRAARWFRGSQ